MRNIKMLITLLITFFLYLNIYSQVTSYKITGQMSDFSQDVLGNSDILILSRVGQPITGTSGNSLLKVNTGIVSDTDKLLELKKISKENEDELAIIKEFRLYQNYPNPFNPSTIIKFDTPVNSFVTVKVYDILGNEIETLINEEKMIGSYEVKFDAGGLSSGIYFYTITAKSFRTSKKMLLMK